MFERYPDLRAIGFHLSLWVQLHIEFDDFCDAKIKERFGGLFDRVGGGLFPAVIVNYSLGTLRHIVLPLNMAPGSRYPNASQSNSALKGYEISACAAQQRRNFFL